MNSPIDKAFDVVMKKTIQLEEIRKMPANLNQQDLSYLEGMLDVINLIRQELILIKMMEKK